MFLLIRLKRHSRMNDFYHRNPAEPSLQLMLQMLHSSNILKHLWDGRQLSLPSELLQAADDANHNQSNYVIRFLDLRSPIFVPNKQSLVTNNRYFLCVFSDKISFSCDKSWGFVDRNWCCGSYSTLLEAWLLIINILIAEAECNNKLLRHIRNKTLHTSWNVQIWQIILHKEVREDKVW